jgi:hypothetical protein
MCRAPTIRNQQVAGSIPAGGSIYVPCNQSIMGTRPFGCAVELPRVGTQAGTQNRHAEIWVRHSRPCELAGNDEWASFKTTPTK